MTHVLHCIWSVLKHYQFDIDDVVDIDITLGLGHEMKKQKSLGAIIRYRTVNFRFCGLLHMRERFRCKTTNNNNNTNERQAETFLGLDF